MLASSYWGYSGGEISIKNVYRTLQALARTVFQRIHNNFGLTVHFYMVISNLIRSTKPKIKNVSKEIGKVTSWTCQVCNLEHQQAEGLGPLDQNFSVTCSRCGKYIISNPALSILPNQEEKDKVKLCSWIRDINERGAETPTITTDTIKMIKEGQPDYTPSEKQLILMRNIEKRTEYPGATINLTLDSDYPLAWALSEKEFDFFLRSLADRNLIKISITPVLSRLMAEVKITPEGWDYLEENKNLPAASDQAFVAMRFSKDLENPYENAMKKAIEDAGYKAYRIDRESHSDRIDVKMMAEIKNSRFLIADVTHQSQDVYFEAGYALGLGIPVIWSCREDDFENRRFDTKQYQHIKWKNEDQLKEELFDYICAIIGKNN